MTVALICLAIGGVWGGHVWLADPIQSLAFWHAPHTWYEKLVSLTSAYGGALTEPVLEGHALEHATHIEHLAHSWALPVSLFVAFGGVALAWAIYGRGWERSQRITGRVTGTLGEAYHAVANKYYVDEVINATVIRGSMLLARGLSLFDKHVIDGIVNAVGRSGKAAGFISAWFDKTFVDGLVNSVALVTQGFGSAVRLVQTGRIQQYATFAVFGGLLAAAWLILS
jgi:NADH-quinone oxidoreductase subunit L